MPRSSHQAAAVQVHAVPEGVRLLCPFEADYVDMFAVDAAQARRTPPEQWARAIMEGAPAAGRFLAWRLLCSLRLRQGQSPDHVAGWSIADRGATWIRMEASSWFITASIVFALEDETILFATFVRYDRLVGALVWTPVSVVHRRVAPAFLGGGVRRVERARRSAARAEQGA